MTSTEEELFGFGGRPYVENIHDAHAKAGIDGSGDPQVLLTELQQARSDLKDATDMLRLATESWEQRSTDLSAIGATVKELSDTYERRFAELTKRIEALEGSAVTDPLSEEALGF